MHLCKCGWTVLNVPTKSLMRYVFHPLGKFKSVFFFVFKYDVRNLIYILLKHLEFYEAIKNNNCMLKLLIGSSLICMEAHFHH